MNEAAKLVAESIANEDFITMPVGGITITVYPPAIKTLCRGLRYFAQIELLDEYDKFSILGEIVNNKEPIINGLSEFIVGDSSWRCWKVLRIRRLLYKCTNSQIKEIWDSITPLIGGEDFFAYALSMKSAARMIAKPKL